MPPSLYGVNYLKTWRLFETVARQNKKIFIKDQTIVMFQQARKLKIFTHETRTQEKLYKK